MKKLATFVLVLCLGAFTIGSVTGCGGKEEKKEEKKADAEKKADDAKADDTNADDTKADSGS